MSERRTEWRRVWLLIQAPRKAPPEVRYSRVTSVHTSRLRAKAAKEKLPLLQRVKTHIDCQMVRIEGPAHLSLDGDFSVERGPIEEIEYTKSENN